MALIIFDLDETLIVKQRFLLDEDERYEDDPVYALQDGDYIEQRTETFIDVTRPLPGIMEMLSSLQQKGHTIALVTSRKEGVNN